MSVRVFFTTLILAQVHLAICQGPLLIRVIPRTIEQLEFIQELSSRKHDSLFMQAWRKADQVDRHTDIWVAQNSYEKLSVILRNQNITFQRICDGIYKALGEKHVSMRNIQKFDDQFQNLKNIYAELKRLSVIFRNHTTFQVIGNSFEKRDIYSMKIQLDKSKAKSVLFLNCGTHSREWLAISSCIYVLRRILFDKDYDDNIQYLLQQYDVMVVPLLNPDGYHYSRKARNRMWRKSRSTTSIRSCRGVDLNRNFDYRWGGAGSSADACEAIYCGERPFSEEETLSLARSIYGMRRDIAAFIDVHAFGQLLMNPWGYTTGETKDSYLQLKTLREIQTVLKEEQDIEYKVGSSSSVLYYTSGDALDWVYGRLRIIHTYGIELRPTFDDKNGFQITNYAIKPTGEDLLVVITTLAKTIRSLENTHL